jgi:flagellar basal body rod protein FlgG
MTLDRSFGALETTGIPTDLAIEGDGLFAIRLTDGSVGYTRAGTFVLSGDGTLTTQIGEPVLDTAGRSIVVPGGAAAFAVGPDGTVAGTGQRIAIAAWPAGGVSRLGQNTYAFSTTPLAGSGTVRQGALERSNVDLPTAMTELITYQRSYALSSRALSLQDETIADAISVGRVR